MKKICSFIFLLQGGIASLAPLAQAETLPNNEAAYVQNETSAPAEQKENTESWTDEQWLRRSPDDIARALAYYLSSYKIEHVERFRNLYQQVPDDERDDSLIDWANASLMARTDIPQAIHLYRVLSGKLPNHNLIRFQLAQLLYQNQEYDAAETQFQKLRADSNITAQDLGIIDEYLTAIANKDKWHFSLETSFIRDKNLNDSADVGTTILLPNGTTLSQDTPHEKGTGFNVNVGIEKQWSLPGGKFVSLDGSTSMKYYWDNHAFNEVNTYIGANYGYSNARVNWKLSPYVLKRFKNTTENGKNHLNSYTNTFGLSTSVSAFITPQWKMSANLGVGHEDYVNGTLDRAHGGNLRSMGTSIMYFPNAKQYFGVSLNSLRREAATSVNAYKRFGGTVFWGQEWPKGFVTSTSVGIAKRRYDDRYWFSAVRRDDKEIDVNVSLWHKAVHFKGVTPRLTFTYHKTKSNIPLFSYDKNLIFIELDKSF